MFINLWTTSPILAGLSRGWNVWYEAMARSQDFSAPWKEDAVDHARAWTLTLKRPAHLLLMTDGFAALTDRYKAYEPAALVKAAISAGLQELGRELRAIEVADAGGSRHPRFKQSDDATAILLRLT